MWIQPEPCGAGSRDMNGPLPRGGGTANAAWLMQTVRVVKRRRHVKHLVTPGTARPDITAMLTAKTLHISRYHHQLQPAYPCVLVEAGLGVDRGRSRQH